jgi:hypothetical protein
MSKGRVKKPDTTRDAAATITLTMTLMLIERRPA